MSGGELIFPEQMLPDERQAARLPGQFYF